MGGKVHLGRRNFHPGVICPIKEKTISSFSHFLLFTVLSDTRQGNIESFTILIAPIMVVLTFYLHFHDIIFENG